MQTIPVNIVKFLSNHHVVSIAAAEEGEVWAACCFYVFDEVNARLIVLTSLKTKHGGMMSRSAKVAGTIAGQPDSIAKISGIQFAATAALIEDEADLKAAQSLYYKAHPAARVCDIPIPEKRRQLIQGVTRCVDCQQKYEMQQRNFRK